MQLKCVGSKLTSQYQPTENRTQVASKNTEFTIKKQ